MCVCASVHVCVCVQDFLVYLFCFVHVSLYFPTLALYLVYLHGPLPRLCVPTCCRLGFRRWSCAGIKGRAERGSGIIRALRFVQQTTHSYTQQPNNLTQQNVPEQEHHHQRHQQQHEHQIEQEVVVQRQEAAAEDLQATTASAAAAAGRGGPEHAEHTQGQLLGVSGVH